MPLRVERVALDATPAVGCIIRPGQVIASLTGVPLVSDIYVVR
jgi:hypothetical protein